MGLFWLWVLPPIAAQSVADLPRWQYTSQVVVGGEENGLTRVGSAVTLGDGSLVFTQPDDGTLIWLDPEGQVLRTVGRRGEGPGEFRVVSLVGVAGDTVWASDGVARRVTLFGKDGTFLNTLPFPVEISNCGSPDRPLRPFMVFPQAVVAGRSFVLDVVLNRTQVMCGTSRADGAEMTTILTSLSGVYQRSILAHPPANEQCTETFRSDRGVINIPLPYCEKAIVVHGPDGRRHATVRANSQNVPDGHVEIGVVGADGTELYRAGIDVRRFRVAQWMDDSARVLLRGRYQPFRGGREAVAGLRIPEYRPAFRGAVFAANGILWVETTGERGRVWVALDSRGEPLGTVDFPATFRIIAARGPRLWVVVRDNVGREVVARVDVRTSRLG